MSRNVGELALHLEAARKAERAACSRYTKLRAAVRGWHKSKATADEDKALREMLSLAGCWPEAGPDTFHGRPWEDLDTRTDVEQAVDEVDFVGAHRRMRGR